MKETRVCIRGKSWVDWKTEAGTGACIKLTAKSHITEAVFNQKHRSHGDITQSAASLCGRFREYIRHSAPIPGIIQGSTSTQDLRIGFTKSSLTIRGTRAIDFLRLGASAHSRKLPYPAYVPKRNGTPKIPHITLVAKKHRLKKQFKRNYLRKGSKFPTLKVSQVKIRKLKRNKSKKKPRRGKKGKSSKSRREFIRKFAKKLERTRKEAKQKAVLKRVISI